MNTTDNAIKFDRGAGVGGLPFELDPVRRLIGKNRLFGRAAAAVNMTEKINKLLGRPDGQMTYRELNGCVVKVASTLRRLGIGRGGCRRVHLPNTPEFLIAWLAIGACGAVMQTVHLLYGLREIGRLIGHSKAKAVIAIGAAKDREWRYRGYSSPAIATAICTKACFIFEGRRV